MIIENNQIRWIGFAIGVEQANIIFFPGLNLIKIYRKNVLCMLMINMNMQCKVQENSYTWTGTVKLFCELGTEN